MISKDTIEKVFETARVEEVIGDFVQLKRAGSNLKGLSPFVNEKSPSFMVSPVKQIWKDFSSGKGGNAVTFLMEHEHFTYPEAIKYLAVKYNIEIEETVQSDEDVAQANEKESMYLVSEFAQKYFHHILLETDEGKAIGLSYFKERGFSADTIKKFGLGYSPETWDAFTKEALGKGYKLDYLDKTGLSIVKEDKQFDRFKGRVMFPIHSMSGRVLGFGGRILTNDKKAAKYLNSPESDIYHKSKVLYGIFHAKQSIAKLNNCFLVEGYTDVIQMHQAGIENVVASSGTALTPDQIRLINRLTPNITVLFDGDAAGLRASIRGIDLILEAGMNVKVCTFPDGDDPDSFARKTSYNDLQLYFEENAKDFIQFKASLLIQEAKNDPIKKADLIRDMVVSISKIPDRIKREVYIKECSRIMDISEDVLFNTLAQLVKKDLSEANKQYKEEQKAFEVVKSDNVSSNVLTSVEISSLIERSILGILIKHGDRIIEIEDIFLRPNEDGEVKPVAEKRKIRVFEKIYLNLQEDEVEFSDEIFKDLAKRILETFLTKGVFDRSEFIAESDGKYENIIADIQMEDEKYTLDGWLEKKQVFVKSKDDDSQVKEHTIQTLYTYREFLLQKLMNNLMQDFLNNDDELIRNSIKEEVSDYVKLKTEISNTIKRVRTDYFKK